MTKTIPADFKAGRHGRVMIGYSQKLVHEFPDGYFTSLVTSPRYNCGKDYNGGLEKGEGITDKTSLIDYLSEITTHFSIFRQKMAYDSLVCVNIGSNAADPLKSYRVCEAIVKAGFHLIQPVIWVKSITVELPEETLEGEAYVDGKWVTAKVRTPKRLRSVGHYTADASNRRFHQAHELVWMFSPNKDFQFDWEGIGVPYQDKSNVKRWEATGGKDLRKPTDCWFARYETTGATKKKGHPAPFPLELPHQAILVSPPGPVLDPYAGTGTTGFAAEELGREWVCMEQNPHAISERLLPREEIAA